MSGMMTPGDPIGDYLEQLRAGLRVPAEEAGLILAEAEDHLRQTVAAGLAAGLSEREAQDAAISSFGSVRAVSRAHQASRSRAALVFGEAGLGAWQLLSLLLLADGISGLLAGVIMRIRHPVATRTFSTVNGMHTVMVQQLFRFLPWCVIAGIGVALLAGYIVVRARQRRRSQRRGPLAGAFPVVTVSLFSTVTLALFALNVSANRIVLGPGVVVITFFVLAVSYGARVARTFLRQG